MTLESSSARHPGGSTARLTSLGLLLAIWLAFSWPLFAARTIFPVDMARGLPPVSLHNEDEGISNPTVRDAPVLYYPWRAYLGESLRSGRLPLWDPHRFAGTPYAANSQVAAFYPPNWLFVSGHVLFVYGLLAAASTLLALLMAWWFFRVCEIHPLAATAGAATFVYSGFLVAWGAHPTFLASAMWLPLALGGLEVAARGRPRHGVPIAGLALALSLLGGHAQVALFVWLTVAVWAGVQAASAVWSARGAGMRALSKGVPVGARAIAAYALGAGLSSLQLLSTLELSRHIVRGGEAYEILVSGRLTARHLSTYLLPERLGNVLDGNYAGVKNFTETAAYAGVITVALALVAIWSRRDRLVLAFSTVTAVGLATAFGTPVFRVLYQVVPGLAQTRGVNRFVFVAGAGIAGLGALGVDRVLTRASGRRTSLVAFAAVGLAVPAMLAIPVPEVSGSYLTPRVVWALGLLVAAWALSYCVARFPRRTLWLGAGLVVLVGADLWGFGFRYHRWQAPAPVTPETPEVEYLRSVPGDRPRFARVDEWILPPNAALSYELFDVQGSDTYVLRRYVELVSLAEPMSWQTYRFNEVGNFRTETFDSPTMDLLGVRSVLVPPPAVIEGTVRLAGPTRVLDRPTAMPPAFLTTCWEVVAPGGDALERLASMESRDLRARAIITPEGAEADPLGPRPDGPCLTGPEAQVLTYEPEYVRLRTSTPVAGVLVLTDSWFPGWKAAVDGRDSPVLRVHHALRGVAVPPGEHVVEFSYRPAWLPRGLAITAFTALMTLALALGIEPRGGRTRRSGPQEDEEDVVEVSPELR